MNVTTMSMTTVSVSKKNPQGINSNSEFTHGNICTKQFALENATSYKARNEKKQLEPTQKTVMNEDPDNPTNRPNRPTLSDPKKGKNTILRNMTINSKFYSRFGKLEQV